jgi:hypothetical protein
MGQICHAHCPPDGGGHVIAAAVAAAGASGTAIAAVIGDILLAAGIIVAVLAVGGAWLLVHLLRRDRGTVTSRKDIAALLAPQRTALPTPRKVITGAYVITDARVAREGARIAATRDGETR